MDESGFCEVTRFDRDKHRIPYQHAPYCICQAHDLSAEYLGLPQTRMGAATGSPVAGHGPARTLEEILDGNRQCLRWFSYRPGFSPKEHLEVERMEELEQRRRDHELRLAAMEQEARRSAEQIQADSLEIAKQIKAATEANKATAEATGKFTSRWTYVAVGIATLAVLLAGVGAFFTAMTYLRPAPVHVQAPVHISINLPTPVP